MHFSQFLYTLINTPEIKLSYRFKVAAIATAMTIFYRRNLSDSDEAAT